MVQTFNYYINFVGDDTLKYNYTKLKKCRSDCSSFIISYGVIIIKFISLIIPFFKKKIIGEFTTQTHYCVF